MRTDMFQQVLEELKGSSADVEASALISTDGLMIASSLPNGMDEDRVGAMSAALLSLAYILNFQLLPVVILLDKNL